MTIDERLEKLTERHEALTQTVELLAQEMRASRQTVELLVREARESRAYVPDIAEATARLLNIAQIREHRITRLEGSEQ